jgi:hypothetical protein
MTVGGAGVAALAFPSLLPSPSRIALAQGDTRRTDPILTELHAQFERAVRGLGATRPRGSAQQLAALYRMLGAWGTANNINAVMRQSVEEAIALQGHHDFVNTFIAFDRVADAKHRGIPVPWNSRPNLTYEETARSIGMVRGGAKIDALWRKIGSEIERGAARFNRRLDILNRQQDSSPIIRLIQDGGCTDCTEPMPDADCTQNADGTFTCYFTNPNVIPDPPSDGNWFCTSEGQQWGALFEFAMAFLCWVDPALCPFSLLGVFAWDYYQASAC